MPAGKVQYTIAHLIASNFYGGPEKQIVEHLKRLDRNCFRGLLLSFEEYGSLNEAIEKAKREGIASCGISMYGPLDVRALFSLVNFVRDNEVDLLCVHGYKACVMGWWAGKRAGIPVLGFSRGYTSENLKISFYNWLERRTLGRLSGVVFVAKGQQDKVIAMGVPIRRSWVVQNAAKVEAGGSSRSALNRRDVCERLGIEESAEMVVSAGRLSPEKGHRYLVEAVPAVIEKKPSVRFVFCGDGPCRNELEKLAGELGVDERCRFVGFRKDLKEIFEAMDLMILPSLTEGLPNVVLEAFACAKPVVATRVGGVPEVVEDGVNGLLVPPARPDLLAEAIHKCIDAPDLGKPMGRAGYHKVKSHFTFEAQTEKLESIYSELLDGKSR